MTESEGSSAIEDGLCTTVPIKLPEELEELGCWELVLAADDNGEADDNGLAMDFCTCATILTSADWYIGT